MAGGVLLLTELELNMATASSFFFLVADAPPAGLALYEAQRMWKEARGVRGEGGAGGGIA